MSGVAVRPDRGRETTGTLIGPYELLSSIGSGGMGKVWLAEQRYPVRRRVAGKIIKPDMDSEQVVARFETERQALALIDHPNIARVLDAGATAHGRPYFVVELVDGMPITGYCDQHQLTIEQRLQLLVKQGIETQFGVIVGTFEYMSPEQTGIDGLDIRPPSRHAAGAGELASVYHCEGK